MINSRDRQVLEKILMHCNDIIEFTAGISFDKFKVSKMCIKAVAFSLMQMGELAKEELTEECRRDSDIPWRAIIALRHKITHHYAIIDEKVLWNIVVSDVPELGESIIKILSDSRSVNKMSLS